MKTGVNLRLRNFTLQGRETSPLRRNGPPNRRRREWHFTTLPRALIPGIISFSSVDLVFKSFHKQITVFYGNNLGICNINNYIVQEIMRE